LAVPQEEIIEKVSYSNFSLKSRRKKF